MGSHALWRVSYPLVTMVPERHHAEGGLAREHDRPDERHALRASGPDRQEDRAGPLRSRIVAALFRPRVRRRNLPRGLPSGRTLTIHEVLRRPGCPAYLGPRRRHASRRASSQRSQRRLRDGHGAVAWRVTAARRRTYSRYAKAASLGPQVALPGQRDRSARHRRCVMNVTTESTLAAPPCAPRTPAPQQ